MTRGSQTNADSHTRETQAGIETDGLARNLFERFAAAQFALMQARALRDQRGNDEQVLRMRGTGLLLACLPAGPESEAHRLKTLVTTALRDEDGSEASHAWRMCEHALRLDGPPPPFTPTER